MKWLALVFILSLSLKLQAQCPEEDNLIKAEANPAQSLKKLFEIKAPELSTFEIKFLGLIGDLRKIGLLKNLSWTNQFDVKKVEVKEQKEVKIKYEIVEDYMNTPYEKFFILNPDKIAREIEREIPAIKNDLPGIRLNPFFSISFTRNKDVITNVDVDNITSRSRNPNLIDGRGRIQFYFDITQKTKNKNRIVLTAGLYSEALQFEREGLIITPAATAGKIQPLEVNAGIKIKLHK